MEEDDDKKGSPEVSVAAVSDQALSPHDTETTKRDSHQECSIALSIKIDDFPALHSNSVRIAVIDPTTIRNKIGKHTMYTIQVANTQGNDASGSFEVCRRYRHFLSLRTFMRQKWPGVLVPGLPPKKLLVSSKQGKLKPKLVESRRKSLDQFCKAVAETSYLYQSDEFQVFCRGSRHFEDANLDFAQAVLGDIRVAYEILFSEMRPDPTQAAIKAEEIPEFKRKLELIYRCCDRVKSEVKKMKVFVEHFQVSVQKLNQAFQHFPEQLDISTVCSPVRVLPEAQVWPSTDSFSVLMDWVKSEQIAMRYMLDTLNSRAELRKRLLDSETRLETSQAHFSALQVGKKSLGDRLANTFKRHPLESLQTSISQVCVL